MKKNGNRVLTEVRISGKTLYVPSVDICGRTVVIIGNWIKTAEIRDEQVVKVQVSKILGYSLPG